MSFGLDIITKDVDGNEVWVEVVDGQTYNLSPMWREALPSITDEGTRGLEGRKCADLLPELEAGLNDATVNQRKYQDMNPPNGWGDFEGFYQTLAKLVLLCRKHPSGVVRWNG
jgi:hypothetical protein